MALETVDFINGLLSCFVVVIFVFVGLTIASRYFKYKRRVFLTMGFAWALISSPWWASSTSFILALITGKGLSETLYIMIANIAIPLFTVFLMAAFAELKYQEKEKIIVITFIIIGILFEIYLFYFLIVDVSQLGELKGLVDLEYRGFLRYFLIYTLVLGVIIGILIAIDSLKSKDPELKLKGKFLLAAFILFTIGAIFDGFLPLTVITLPIIRLVIILSSILFYCGYILPDWLKNLILKE